MTLSVSDANLLRQAILESLEQLDILLFFIWDFKVSIDDLDRFFILELELQHLGFAVQRFNIIEIQAPVPAQDLIELVEAVIVPL